MSAKTLLWLASFPKSGNTWTRIFLANYVFDPERPLPINEIKRIGTSDDRRPTHEAVARRPIEPADHEGALSVRPKMLAAIAGNGADLNFLKTHNLNAPVFGTQLIPPALTRGAVYILRNPLDVAVSYARHFGLTPARAVANLGDPNNTTAVTQASVKSFLGSWSEHVTSWTAGAAFPVLTLRYEDMLASPEETFTEMLDFIGIPPVAERVAKAVRFSAFEEVSAQEASTPFAERSSHSERFFHSGTSGQWQAVLAPEEAAQILADHGPVMRAHGYL